MGDRFRVGIIGCGNIFPMHAAPVMSLEQCELSAVCDIKEERAREWAKKLSCRAYADYRQMIEAEKLDVVHVCTPHCLHPEMAVYALEHGAHVMTEKPMSIGFADARRMAEAAERTGRTLGVIFQNRYNPGSRLAKQMLGSGELGKVLGARLFVTWTRTGEYYSGSDWKGTWDKEGGGVVIDQAIHTFDLLRWLLEDRAEYVEASIHNRAHPSIEVEDCAEGIIQFRKGVLASFYTMNYYSRNSAVELEFHCENGRVQIRRDACYVALEDGRRMSAERDPEEDFSYGDIKGYWGVSHVKQIQAFYQSLADGTQPAINGREAEKTMELICALYESGKTGKRVYLDEFLKAQG